MAGQSHSSKIATGPAPHPAGEPKEALSLDPLPRLTKVLEGMKGVVIYSHLNPDPDTVGAALGLRWLLEQRYGLKVVACYRGMIGRAENRQLMRVVGREMVHAAQVQEAEFDGAFMVDCQPDPALRSDKDRVPILGVIDHHPAGESLSKMAYADVRPDYGSTSTIVTEYMRALGLEPPTEVATALFYGLKTDTQDLSRRTSPADIAAYEWLQARVDRKALCLVENPPLTREYFERFVGALGRAVVYRSVILTEIGRMPYADMVAEVADRMIMLEGMEFSVCFGASQNRVYLSVRTSSASQDAGSLVRQVLDGEGVGGGHDRMAAGRVQLQDDSDELYVEVVTRIWNRFLTVLGEDATRGKPLVQDCGFPARIHPVEGPPTKRRVGEAVPPADN